MDRQPPNTRDNIQIKAHQMGLETQEVNQVQSHTAKPETETEHRIAESKKRYIHLYSDSARSHQVGVVMVEPGQDAYESLPFHIIFEGKLFVPSNYKYSYFQVSAYNADTRVSGDVARPYNPKWEWDFHGVTHQVLGELERQNALGHTPERDMANNPPQWVGLITKHLHKGFDISRTGDIYGNLSWRTQLIRVAALAVAAVMDYDRKVPSSPAYRNLDTPVQPGHQTYFGNGKNADNGIAVLHTDGWRIHAADALPTGVEPPTEPSPAYGSPEWLAAYKSMGGA